MPLVTPVPLRIDHQVFTPLAEEALGARCGRSLNLATPASLTWTANLAVFVPFGISRPFTVLEVWWHNGSVADANIDVGVYTTAGVRLFSLGSTDQGAANVIVTSAAMTDFTLAPGDYYMAFASDGTTNDVGGFIPAANNAAAFGVGEMAAAFPLPAPATIVPLTNAMVPYFGLNGSTVAV